MRPFSMDNNGLPRNISLRCHPGPRPTAFFARSWSGSALAKAPGHFTSHPVGRLCCTGSGSTSMHWLPRPVNSDVFCLCKLDQRTPLLPIANRRAVCLLRLSPPMAFNHRGSPSKLHHLSTTCGEFSVSKLAHRLPFPRGCRAHHQKADTRKRLLSPLAPTHRALQQQLV